VLTGIRYLILIADSPTLSQKTTIPVSGSGKILVRVLKPMLRALWGLSLAITAKTDLSMIRSMSLLF